MADKIYEIAVQEVQVRNMFYRIRARNKAEALKKAEIGDTLDSDDNGIEEVISRNPNPDSVTRES